MDAFKKSVSLNEAMPVPDLHAVSLVSHVCLALLYFSLPESSFVWFHIEVRENNDRKQFQSAKHKQMHNLSVTWAKLIP